MSVIKMTDLDLAGKCAFIRADLNIPVKDGKVISNACIRAFLPTTELALKQDAKVTAASRLGRPTEGKHSEEFSLLPVVNYLKDKLSDPIRLIKDYLDGVEVTAGELVVLGNIRSNKGEKKDDEALSKKHAALCDVFVVDALGTAHRMQVSARGIGKFVDVARAGPLLAVELDALGRVLEELTRPMVAIVGGSRVFAKLTMLDSLSKITDQLVVGGGITNTFVAAQGRNVGRSLYEADLADGVKRLLSTYDTLAPVDVRAAIEFSEIATTTLKSVNDAKDDERILDLDDVLAQRPADILKDVKTILWDGPAGVFEFPDFRRRTKIAVNATADSEDFSTAGGGDTLVAIDLFGAADKISYISADGGALFEFTEDKVPSAVATLEEHAKQQFSSGGGIRLFFNALKGSRASFNDRGYRYRTK